MIGNDVVDLELSRKESNWRRKGFLDKIFTKNEQFLIQNSENQEIAIWNLWSKKEAVYKIWNRETRIRKFNPIQFHCLNFDLDIGIVSYNSNIYFTKTEITTEYIYTIAALNKEDFSKIKTFNNSVQIKKLKGIPFYNVENQEIIPVSKTHHGRFEFIIGLRNP